MKTTTHLKRRSNLPFGLLGMIVLVIVIESIIGRCHSRTGQGIGYEWWLTNQRAALGSRRYDVLCFGDSQMKLDVQPRVIEPILGRSVFDLAIVSGQATSSYYLFRRALDAGARPTAVLVDFYHPLLAGALTQNREWWPLILNSTDAAELTWSSGEPDSLADWLLHKTLPTYRFRTPIRHSLGIGNVVLDPYEEGALFARNSAQNRGAMAGDENPVYHDDPTKLDPFNTPIRFGCTALNALYLEKFLELAARHNIRVFYLICPCTPNWQRASTARDPEGKYEQAIRRHVLIHPNVQVVDARFAGYERTLFSDHSHLSHRGAMAFSTDLAHLVKQELGPEETHQRWLKLRRLPTSPPVVHLETISESRQTVRERAERLRR